MLSTILDEIEKRLQKFGVLPLPATWSICNDNGLPIMDVEVRDNALEEVADTLHKRFSARK
jgi:hypothetical protein